MRGIAGTILGILLFAQGALAIAACMLPARVPAAAIAQSATPPCHEELVRADSLCVAHCVADLQNLERPVAWNAMPPGAPVLEVRGTCDAGEFPAAQRNRLSPQAAAPPRILFLHLLI